MLRLLILRLTLVCAFIPSVSFGTSDLDTQPFAFCLGLLCILSSLHIKLPSLIWLLLIPALISVFLAISSASLITGARAVTIYTSPFVFAAVGYFMSKQRLNIYYYAVVMLHVWLSISLLQFFISPDIIDYLVNVRSSAERGVTGLAPEPSFYGLTIIQMMLLLFLINERIQYKKAIFAVGVFQIFILAKSSLAIIIFLSIGIIFFTKKLKLMLVAGLCLGIFLNVVSTLPPDNNRAVQLLNLFIADPYQVIYADGSVADRAFHVFLSLKNAFSSGLRPHGFDSFSFVISQGQLDYPAYWWGIESNKIMSGIGGAVFELGWFSIFYLFVFFRYVGEYKFASKNDRLVFSSGVIFVWMNSISFAAPLFGLMIGVMAHSISTYKHNETRTKLAHADLGMPAQL